MERGDSVVGKWSGTTFVVIKKLGEGTSGAVYLVKTPRGTAAMKVFPNARDVALEWGLLERFRNSALFPRQMMIDDATDSSRFFYVMEWIPGDSLDVILPTLTPVELISVVKSILLGLSYLHSHGHVFCDVKPQNMILSQEDTSKTVRFVDVGGVTEIGRSVRQFTPFYDRAFWGFGTRVAEPTYDLCGVALMLICELTEKPSPTLAKQPPSSRKAWLMRRLRQFPIAQHRDILHRMLTGDCATADDCRHAWTVYHPHSLVKGARNQSRTRGRGSAQPISSYAQHMDWTAWLMWVTLGMATTVTAIAWMTFLH